MPATTRKRSRSNELDQLRAGAGTTLDAATADIDAAELQRKKQMRETLAMANIIIPLPPSADSKDIVDLIQYDHFVVESHFREMRNRTSNRVALLSSLANLLLAHSEAEEQIVYPRIREAAKAAAEQQKEQKPDAELQHTEAVANLLALYEADITDHSAWEMKLEALILGVLTHAAEEEMTLLNIARTDLTTQQRIDIGAAFSQARTLKLSENIGRIDNVRKMVKEREAMMKQLKEKLMLMG